MVTRKRLRSFLTTLGLYVGVALLIGYFGVNAYTGNHGLRAQKDLDQQIAQSSVELAALKAERVNWERAWGGDTNPRRPGRGEHVV